MKRYLLLPVTIIALLLIIGCGIKDRETKMDSTSSDKVYYNSPIVTLTYKNKYFLQGVINSNLDSIANIGHVTVLDKATKKVLYNFDEHEYFNIHLKDDSLYLKTYEMLPDNSFKFLKLSPCYEYVFYATPNDLKVKKRICLDFIYYDRTRLKQIANVYSTFRLEPLISTGRVDSFEIFLNLLIKSSISGDKNAVERILNFPRYYDNAIETKGAFYEIYQERLLFFNKHIMSLLERK